MRLSTDYVYMGGKPVLCPGTLDEELKANNIGSFKLKRNKVRLGSRPQGFFKAPEPATDFYYNNVEHFEGYINVDAAYVVKGAFHTNKHSIQSQMDCENYDGEKYPTIKAFKDFSKVIRNTIKKIKPVHVAIPTIDELEDVQFNLKTKPGFRYEEYFRFFSKADARDLALEISRERWKRIDLATASSLMIERKKIIPGIISIGARNKRESEVENFTFAESRAVHMPEYHTELHCGVFVDRITDCLKERTSGPIYIGNSYLNFSRLERDMDKNTFAFEGDWKGFDKSISNSLILMSLSIIRCFYPKSFSVDNHFLAILDSIVLKDYVMPGGFMYRILHGLPSGSKLTSLLGSVFNMLCLMHSLQFINNKKLSFAIGGDDFVIFIRTEKFTYSEVETKFLYYCAKIGMVIKYFKYKPYRSGIFNDLPVFYKYTVWKGVPVVPAESLIERTFVPWNVRYKTSSELLKFLNDQLTSIGYPVSSCFIFYAYYSDIYFRVFNERLLISDVYNIHKNIYFKMQRRGYLYKYSPSLYVPKVTSFGHRVEITKYVENVFGL